MKIKLIFLLFFVLTINSSAKINGISDLIKTTLGITFMPTILPLYSTVQYNAPHPYAKRRRFMKDNFDELKEEIAKGEGEHLDTLGRLFNLKYIEKWKLYLQTNFEDIYQKDKSQDDIVNYISEITLNEFSYSKQDVLREEKKSEKENNE